MTTTHFFGAELNLLIKVQNIVTTSQIHNKEKRYKKKIQSAHRLHVTLFFFSIQKNMSFSFYFVTSLSDVIEVAIAHAKIIVKDAEKHEKEKHNTYI